MGTLGLRPMKHAFCREVRFAGHRNAGFAAASAALESRTPLGFTISSVAPRRGKGLGCRDRP